jgi:hypothetical protein
MRKLLIHFLVLPWIFLFTLPFSNGQNIIYISANVIVPVASSCGGCSQGSPCAIPSSTLTLAGGCAVTFLAGNYTSKPLFDLVTTANSAYIIVETSGVVTGLKMSLRSTAMPGLMQIRNSRIDDLTLSMESTRGGTIVDSIVSLKYGVQHTLNFPAAGFTLERSNLTMAGADSYAVPVFAGTLLHLSFIAANVRLPMPFSTSSINSISIAQSSLLELPSFGIAQTVTITQSIVKGLHLGFGDPSPEGLDIILVSSRIQRTGSSPNPLIPSAASIIRVEFTNAIIVNAPIEIVASQSVALTFTGQYVNSPLRLSSPSPSMNVALGGSFLQTTAPTSTDPPLIYIAGPTSFGGIPTTVNFVAFTAFNRPIPNEWNLCDLSVSRLLMTGSDDSSYPYLDNLCIGGSVNASMSMEVLNSIGSTSSSYNPNILRGQSASGSTRWTLSSIEYSVDIVTDISIQYQVTSPSQGIHRNESMHPVSFSFSSPSVEVNWASSDPFVPDHLYPLIDHFTNLSSTAPTTNEAIVLTHSGSPNSTLYFSSSSLPSPTTVSPVTSTCPQPQPGPTFYCVGGHWQSDVTVEQPVIVFPGSGVILVNGNLTVNQSVTFTGPDSSLNITGCAFITGPVTIVLTEEDLERLGSGSGSRQLITQNGCTNSTDLSGLSVTVSNPSGGCRSVTAQNVGTPSSLSVIFTVSRCSNKKSNVVAIAVPVIVGIVIIAALIGSLIYWRHYKAKMKPKREEAK